MEELGFRVVDECGRSETGRAVFFTKGGFEKTFSSTSDREGRGVLLSGFDKVQKSSVEQNGVAL